MPKLTEPCYAKWLGENVSELHVGTHMGNINVTLLHMVSQEMIPNINMFCARVINGVLGDLYGTFIITEKRNVSIRDTIIL